LKTKFKAKIRFLNDVECFLSRSSVCGWSGGVEKDTTDTGTTDFERHSDVSLFTPCWSPGVSDNEVFLSGFSSVSNSSDGVVKVVSTFLGVEDTSLVVHEV